VPLVALVVGGYIGDALAPELVANHPAWLLALNPRNRNLILVTNQLDAVTYYTVGFIRLVLSDPLWFLLGYWYGDAAVAWMEKRTRTWGQMLRRVQELFNKASYPLIFIAPNNFICLFAGAAGMPVRVFIALNITGTAARLWVFRQFGDAFQKPIDNVVEWIGDHRMFLLPLSIGLTVLSIALEARKGETEVTALTHLDEELEGGDDPD
jgi:membrane protein DedA with SNARE-associated domain